MGVFTVGSMSTTRSHHRATQLLNGKVLIAGGYFGTSANVSLAELFE